LRAREECAGVRFGPCGGVGVCSTFQWYDITCMGRLYPCVPPMSVLEVDVCAVGR
jgi:hypothetical protein